MRYRMLGKTGLKVSELSFGCASLGQSYAGRKAPSRKDAIRLLRKAYDAGINFFDTAPSYGDSEEILGEALGDTDAIFCTKYGSKFKSRLSRVDVLLKHNARSWTKKDMGDGMTFPWFRTVSKIEWMHCPIIQLPYNILTGKFWGRKVSNYGPAIIARQPYARGLLCNPPWNIGEQALRFCLSNKHISTVLVGMQTEEELYQNIRWAEMGPLPLTP